MNARNIAHTLVICLCAGVTPSRGEIVVLARAGKPAAEIVLPADSEPDVRKAATELSAYVEKLCGVALPVRDHGDRVAGTALYLGPCDRSLPSDLPVVTTGWESSAREAFAIRVREGTVFFASRSSAGICYAVLAFIEDDLGVRWFAPGDLWEYVPQHERGHLAVEVEDRTVVPDTPLRVWSGHQWFPSWREWNCRNRVTSRTKPVRSEHANQLQGAFPSELYGKTHPK